MTNRSDDPVWQAFENAEPRTTPLTPEQREMRARSLEDIAAGRTISQKTIEAILWLEARGYRVTKEEAGLW